MEVGEAVPELPTLFNPTETQAFKMGGGKDKEELREEMREAERKKEGNEVVGEMMDERGGKVSEEGHLPQTTATSTSTPQNFNHPETQLSHTGLSYRTQEPLCAVLCCPPVEKL